MALRSRSKHTTPTAPLNRCAHFLISLATTLATAAPIAAQGVSTAGLRGRILDQEGAAIEGALVTLEHTETGATNTAITSGDGRYTLRSLRPGGPYTMTVTRIGFGDQTREDLELLLGRFVNLNVTLVPEAVEVEGIEVEVRRDIEFDPGRIGLSTLVTSEIIEDLPTLTRNFVDFAALSPLARVSEEGVSVAGTNFRFNTLNVDGALNQDVFGLSTDNVAGGRAGGRVIPLEAVEQFQVLVAPFDIRHSGFTGGAMNAVTKSGTNDFETFAFGFYRSGALVGELVIDDVATVPDVSTAHGGFTVGGPIRRDRAHFFIAGEWEQVREPPNGLHVGESDPFRLSLVADSVARLTSLLKGYGTDPGTASSFTLENTIFNLFARVDWEMDERHDAMLRYSFASANDDTDPNRLPGDLYELSSSGSKINSRNHSVVFQLFSALPRGLSNEFAFNVQHLDDSETARSASPQIEVKLDGTVDGFRVRRDVRSGASYFSQHNGLRQRVVQLSNNLSYDAGRHSLLLGASGTWFAFDPQYVPGRLGSYEFESLEDLEQNRPDRYEITRPLTRDGWNPHFGVTELSVYVQDEWAGSERFTLRGGLRLDLPVFGGRPEHNEPLDSILGIDTSKLPEQGFTASVRGGFNWRPFDGTQLRAGAGIFTGRPTFAWVANAFQNNGIAVQTLVCRGDRAPSFNPRAAAPSKCRGGPRPWQSTPVINYFDPEFRFPQDLRTMIALDQRLPGGLVLSGNLLYNHALNQIFIQDDNLMEELSEGSPREGFTDGFGFNVRQVFGSSTGGTSRGIGMEQLWEGGRRYEQFGPVLRVTNRGENFTYAATVEVRKDFGETLGLRAGYSLTRSADLQNLTSIDVTSNYASTPVNLHPNLPVRQSSRFDRPHKVVASAHATILPRFGGTEITVLYVGQSGVPYSYVYKGDVNGDGFPGPRASSLSNDLLYIPDLPSDFPFAGFGSLKMWATLYELEDCLQEQRNRILARNTCSTPWSNQVDIRVAQTVKVRGLSAQLTLDLLNVLNLLDSSQGIVYAVNPVVKAFEVRRTLLPYGLGAHYISTAQRNRETGRVLAALPYAPEVPTSQWRAQLGVRVAR
ncbi:MAG: TonB-dependent receptor [Gemmatimonadetes bacterium]|nr:TonB-dependent receptor [Gemmatimonadota bacterium]MYD14799.1 TonB-dependent receptor [Gemmatimonadota bacterium]MYE70818.1 TonB-dependent receptor [Gemmatimonadota bacterium]MYJ67199.1 TonB-dependent receptor [Gemmatimonadota bacterium]